MKDPDKMTGAELAEAMKAEYTKHGGAAQDGTSIVQPFVKWYGAARTIAGQRLGKRGFAALGAPLIMEVETMEHLTKPQLDAIIEETNANRVMVGGLLKDPENG